MVYFSANDTIVQRSFEGHAITRSRCRSCGTESEHADHFRELQLSFPNKSNSQSVQTLLDYYLEPEILCEDNQYHCDTCHGLTDGERVTIIVKPPRRLVLTLKHFRYDAELQQHTKMLQRVMLNGTIHLGEQYELYGVVVHCGISADSGHYYTFAKDAQEWYKFNDRAVTEVTEEELGSIESPVTPYILFYSRIDYVEPANLPRALLPSQLEAALSNDDADYNTQKKKQQISVHKIHKNNSDEPPPPGCGDGGFFGSSLNRYIC